MTSKEKAEELFDKMYMVKDPMGNYPMCFDTAKQCAMISVDEIIFSHIIDGIIDYEIEIYWDSVKQEIEKL